MDNLLKKLETLEVRDDFCENSGSLCADLIRGRDSLFVPQRTIGTERPCEEKDFKEYRLVVERKLRNIRSMLQEICNNCRERQVKLCNANSGPIQMFGMNLLLLIGEHSERNIWNTAECVSISKELLAGFCDLYSCQNVSQFLSKDENFISLLLMLRPKLLKDTWKTYPSAVACYRWILQEAEVSLRFSSLDTCVLLDHLYILLFYVLP